MPAPKYLRDASPPRLSDPLTDPRFDCTDRLSTHLVSNLRPASFGARVLAMPPDDDDVDIETWFYRLMSGDHEAKRAPHVVIDSGFRESRLPETSHSHSHSLGPEARSLQPEAEGEDER
jgi:hypothetical protein